MKIQLTSKAEERAMRMAERSFRWWRSVPACVFFHLLPLVILMGLLYYSGKAMPVPIVVCAKSGNQLVPLEAPLCPFGLSAWDFLRYTVIFSFGFLLTVQGVVDILALRERRTYCRIIKRLASQEAHKPS